VLRAVGFACVARASDECGRGIRGEQQDQDRGGAAHQFR
jgi:hypothetical protein